LTGDQASAYFDRAAAYWRDVYTHRSVQGLVYRERFSRVLDWGDRLMAQRPGQILEIGPGAGRLTVELARRDHHVHSIDSSEAMLELTAQHCAERGLQELVTVQVGDVHRLEFPDQSFDMVVAVGVLPWLERPAQGLREMARVLAPGGYLVMTADNQARMNILVEPRLTPLLLPVKLARRAFRRLQGHRPESAVSRMHTGRALRRMLRDGDMQVVSQSTVGFGPFTFLDRRLLPEWLGMWVHRRLQALADRGVRPVRSMGWHHLVVARRRV
jgi:ubiquinone/menaquinone biosynthesis C-methylase UbiE